ncbi:MAG TPA: hypothetical protein VNF69_06205 [Burkholderiales bacterium]|nr:hypothetical protein [Burkholderiales bacterium]
MKNFRAENRAVRALKPAGASAVSVPHGETEPNVRAGAETADSVFRGQALLSMHFIVFF